MTCPNCGSQVEGAYNSIRLELSTEFYLDESDHIAEYEKLKEMVDILAIRPVSTK